MRIHSKLLLIGLRMEIFDWTLFSWYFGGIYKEVWSAFCCKFYKFWSFREYFSVCQQAYFSLQNFDNRGILANFPISMLNVLEIFGGSLLVDSWHTVSKHIGRILTRYLTMESWLIYWRVLEKNIKRVLELGRMRHDRFLSIDPLFCK